MAHTRCGLLWVLGVGGLLFASNGGQPFPYPLWPVVVFVLALAYTVGDVIFGEPTA